MEGFGKKQNETARRVAEIDAKMTELRQRMQDSNFAENLVNELRNLQHERDSLVRSEAA